MKVGDRVKKSDITADSIPAYKVLRGTVVWMSEKGDYCKVHWDCDSSPDVMHRKVSTVVLVDS